VSQSKTVVEFVSPQTLGGDRKQSSALTSRSKLLVVQATGELSNKTKSNGKGW